MKKTLLCFFILILVLWNTMLFSEENMICPKCNGQGSEACKVCKEGLVVCFDRCIKEDKFNTKPVKKEGWINVIVVDQHQNTHHSQCHKVHIGEILDYENNTWVPKGKCPTCSGTGKNKCKRCKGTLAILCSVCNGKKEVSESKGNEYIKKQKAIEKNQTVKLKNGQIIKGKKVMETKDKIGIKTLEGKLILVNKNDIEE